MSYLLRLDIRTSLLLVTGVPHVWSDIAGECFLAGEETSQGLGSDGRVLDSSETDQKLGQFIKPDTITLT
jgi:hypothetical protein